MRIIPDSANDKWWGDMHSMDVSIAKSFTIEITDNDLDELGECYEAEVILHHIMARPFSILFEEWLKRKIAEKEKK